MKHPARTPLGRLAVGIGTVAALVAMMTGPADAALVSTYGTSTSISAWSYGGTQRSQTAAGQDIRLNLSSGPGIDAKWYKCGDRGTSGPTRSNIYVSSGWRTIGTDFLPNTCFSLAWRGADVVGTWTGQLQFQVNVL